MKHLFNLILVAYICATCITFSSCGKEIITETEFITVNDTIIIASTDTIIINTIDTIFNNSIDTILVPDEADVTCFILVKHAEKGPDGDNPNLTQEGMERAERLANILSQLELDKVYSTLFQRTRQTALPTAEDQGLDLTNYGGFDHDEVIDDILANNNQGRILIVGHSNTTPNFINALTGTLDFPEITEDTFDDLFIVKTKSKGDSEVVHLKY